MYLTKQEQTDKYRKQAVVISGEGKGEEQCRGRRLRGTPTVYKINKIQGHSTGNTVNIL